MPKTFTRKKIFVVALVIIAAFVGLFARLSYLMLVRSDYYYQKAQALH
ncbi:MAG TPA: cell division protein FtsI, partial [Lachnospiraceae bacterium]|nr:cell division protein FtsI [Lachnospiraceae bacterium]